MPVIADLIRNPEGRSSPGVIPRVPHRHSRAGGNPQGSHGSARHCGLDPQSRGARRGGRAYNKTTSTTIPLSLDRRGIKGEGDTMMTTARHCGFDPQSIGAIPSSRHSPRPSPSFPRRRESIERANTPCHSEKGRNPHGEARPPRHCGLDPQSRGEGCEIQQNESGLSYCPKPSIHRRHP